MVCEPFGLYISLYNHRLVFSCPQEGVALVHCNAGVSRSAAIVIGYLMSREGLAFNAALALVKAARPAIRPNPGFHEQLKDYRP